MVEKPAVSQKLRRDATARKRLSSQNSRGAPQGTESLNSQEKNQVCLLQSLSHRLHPLYLRFMVILPEGALVTVTRPRTRGHTTENASL